jgi:hypothetical protein
MIPGTVGITDRLRFHGLAQVGITRFRAIRAENSLRLRMLSDLIANPTTPDRWRGALEEARCTPK